MDEHPFSAIQDPDSGALMVAGSVDAEVMDEFRRVLEECSAGGSRDLIVDLTEVDYLPSFAIAVLIGALKQSQEAGSALTLIAAEGSIAQRVLQMGGVEHSDGTTVDETPHSHGTHI